MLVPLDLLGLQTQFNKKIVERGAKFNSPFQLNDGLRTTSLCVCQKKESSKSGGRKKQKQKKTGQHLFFFALFPQTDDVFHLTMASK